MALTDGILAYWNLDNDGSGGVSLLDSTGNGNTLTNNGGISLGTGIIEGCAVGNSSGYLVTNNNISFPSDFSFNFWFNNDATSGGDNAYQLISGTGGSGISLQVRYGNNQSYGIALISRIIDASVSYSGWNMYSVTRSESAVTLYLNGNVVGTGTDSTAWDTPIGFFATADGQYAAYGNGNLIDEVGVWSRSLSPTEVTTLYNSGAGFTYPFNPSLINLYYNNAQEDGDWGNLLNWWLNSGFTIQATALPTSTNPVNLYGAVTKNTQGANQCFCASANFWSANFGQFVTLQSTGVVNMYGTSIMDGATTDGVSMHDSSQLTAVSYVAGNVTMRDSSRAFGVIDGNATIYYDGGNGQFPIGGSVTGSVTYLGWPAISPQWFNDQATGGADDGDFSNLANWWTDNNYNVRPINSVGTQALPDASTDVFIAPNTGIVANTGTANPTINSVTANNSNIQNISITATNGFLFSGNEGVANAVLYGNVIFQDTAYNDHAVIQGKATYKSAASLQYSWGQNSLGNVNAGMYNGSTAFEVNISSGGGSGNGGFISRLLHLPWFINI